MFLSSLSQIIPVVAGIAAVIAVAVAAHYYFNKLSKGGKNNKKKRTLLDATQKYMLPLIEKEEISHDTKRKFKLIVT